MVKFKDLERTKRETIFLKHSTARWQAVQPSPYPQRTKPWSLTVVVSTSPSSLAHCGNTLRVQVCTPLSRMGKGASHHWSGNPKRTLQSELQWGKQVAGHKTHKTAALPCYKEDQNRILLMKNIYFLFLSLPPSFALPVSLIENRNVKLMKVNF